MLSYVFIGLALGSIYAIASASIVVTYLSAGILNFAFGSMAYFVARLFYWLNTEHGWGLLPAAVVALGLASPALGVTLYLAVFRHLRDRPELTRIVTTIGVSVALPAITDLVFGVRTISTAPGLAPLPVKYWHAFGATVTLDQINIYIALIVMVGAGTLVLRFTNAGLKVRAMVSSEAMTSLSGVNPNRVALAVWGVSGLLAGLAGLLVAPTVGVTIGGMTLLMAQAFAAVVAARLTNLAVAVAVALLIGLITDVSQYYLPQNSPTTANIVACVPFAVVVVFLLYWGVRGGTVGRTRGRGSALDQAIRAPSGNQSVLMQQRPGRATAWYRPQHIVGLLPILLIALVPAVASGYWLTLVVAGTALAVVLASFTIVTGEGGMIWLCQITFAGGGAVVAAQLAKSAGLSPLLAVVIGAFAMAPVGALIGLLTIRLGELYVALVTLSFGLLIDTSLFNIQRVLNFGVGVELNRPSFASDDRRFAYLCLSALLVIGLIIGNLRRSTTGLATTAVRGSEPAARTLGLSIVRIKVSLAAFAAFVAGLGGGLVAMVTSSANPVSFTTFTGLVWMAALVTVGLRSIVAAALGGLGFALVPGVFAVYLSTTWGTVPAILFGLGAIAVAQNPDGLVVTHARQIRHLLARFESRRTAEVAGPAGTSATRGDAPEAARLAAVKEPVN